MEEPELFIEKITINEVRHLKDVEIPISTTERKHLILTGKNGSGKTSVLEAMKKVLNDILIDKLEYNKETETGKKILETQLNLSKVVSDSIKKTEQLLKNSQNKKEQEEIKKLHKSLEKYYSSINNEVNPNRIDQIDLAINNLNLTILKEIYQEGLFLFTFFNAKRTSKFQIPESKGGKRIFFKKRYTANDYIAKFFLQNLVNLKTEQSFARNEKRMHVVKQIDTWFFRFEKALQYLFDDNLLKLKFDSRKFNFELVLGNGQISAFNKLSDGYSAILQIIIELMLRMEGKVKNVYDIQGIVLIDEVETHLHIDLQKKILPFLTSFFPKIQFIVSTHSPFVISSLSNAVVYDLENHTRFEDLSDYPIDGIVEGYFDNDKYSAAVTEKIKEYEVLTEKDTLTEIETKRRYELFQQLSDVSGKLAPELKMKFQQIQLKRLAKANG